MKLALVIAACALGALALQPGAVSPPGSALATFVWGVGTHLISSDDGAQKLDYLRDLHAGSFRDDLHWSRLETRKHVYATPPAWDRFVAAAQEHGIAPLLILDYGNPNYDAGERPNTKPGIEAFAAYAGFVASHFKAAHPIYEVWNEWPMPSRAEVRGYIALLSATSRAIKQADPAATVIGGGFNVRGVDALATFVAEGGMQHLDGLSIHPYVHCEHSREAQGFMQLVMQMGRITAGAGERPLYITEAGWPTHAGACGVSEQRAAQYLAEAYLIARCLPRVAGLWWYDLKNDGAEAAEREHNFGLFAADWRPKPAVEVARRIGALNGALRCEQTIRTAPAQAQYRVGAEIVGYDAMRARLLGRAGPEAR